MTTRFQADISCEKCREKGEVQITETDVPEDFHSFRRDIVITNGPFHIKNSKVDEVWCNKCKEQVY
jgi:hypothetical protein